MCREVVISGKATISYDESGVLKVKMLPKAVIDLQAAQEIVRIASTLTGIEPHCNLIDIQKINYITSDAQKHFSRQDQPNVPAIAILIDSRIQKNLANLYFKFSNPMIPSRAFDNEKIATDWLMQKLKEFKELL